MQKQTSHNCGCPKTPKTEWECKINYNCQVSDKIFTNTTKKYHETTQFCLFQGKPIQYINNIKLNYNS